MSWMIPAATALFNLGASYFGNKARKKEADKAYQRQQELNKQGQALGIKTWEETNYPEQVKKLKEAGLNPGLVYGMGGGAGGTVASGSGGSAQQANIENMNYGDAGGMALMTAQKKNIEAQTELAKANANKANVEATKTAGVDTEETQARTKDLLQGVENKRAQEHLTDAQTALTNIQNLSERSSYTNRMNKIEYESKTAFELLRQAKQEANLSEETYNDKVEIIQQEAIAGVIKNMLMEAQVGKTQSDIQVNNAQISKMAEDIAQGWKGLQQGDEANAIKKFSETVKANYPGILNTAGRLADDTIELLFRGKGGRKTTKGMQ